MKKIWILLMLLAPLGAIFALGGGGVMFQSNANFNLNIDNTGLGDYSIRQIGGFGYGVDENGAKIGGFGLSLEGEDEEVDYGGFGGLLLGAYGRLGPFALSFNGLLGIGSLQFPALIPEEGSAALFAQGDVEVGIPITKWFLLSAYAGAQVIWPMDGAAEALRMPIVGMRLTWGAF